MQSRRGFLREGDGINQKDLRWENSLFGEEFVYMNINLNSLENRENSPIKTIIHISELQALRLKKSGQDTEF